MIDPISDESSQLINESNARLVAIYKSQQMSNKAIADTMSMSQHAVAKIINSEEFRTELRTITDEAVDLAANTWKRSISELVIEAKRVLIARLKADDLEAVKLIVRSLGVEKNEQQIQQGNITVVLPNLDEPKTIEVVND